MTNQFGIPIDIELKLRQRDKFCVYCHKKMKYPWDSGNRSYSATIEHFREEGPFYWNKGLKIEDLAICCGSCNSSRGKKTLFVWFKSSYCIKNNINSETVLKPVRNFLKKINSI